MYTKHQWKSDRYFNFPYVQYLPKDLTPTRNIPWYFSSTVPENGATIWMWQAVTAI